MQGNIHHLGSGKRFLCQSSNACICWLRVPQAPSRHAAGASAADTSGVWAASTGMVHWLQYAAVHKGDNRARHTGLAPAACLHRGPRAYVHRGEASKSNPKFNGPVLARACHSQAMVQHKGAYACHMQCGSYTNSPRSPRTKGARAIASARACSWAAHSRRRRHEAPGTHSRSEWSRRRGLQSVVAVCRARLASSSGCATWTRSEIA